MNTDSSQAGNFYRTSNDVTDFSALKLTIALQSECSSISAMSQLILMCYVCFTSQVTVNLSTSIYVVLFPEAVRCCSRT